MSGAAQAVNLAPCRRSSARRCRSRRPRRLRQGQEGRHHARQGALLGHAGGQRRHAAPAPPATSTPARTARPRTRSTPQATAAVHLVPGANSTVTAARTSLPPPGEGGRSLLHPAAGREQHHRIAGVFDSTFLGVVRDSAVELGTRSPIRLPRRVHQHPPGHRPQRASVINAVFNYNNFWDGRANFVFNSVSPFGDADRARASSPTTATARSMPVAVHIENGSLASQAVGPPGSDTEMSWAADLPGHRQEAAQPAPAGEADGHKA